MNRIFFIHGRHFKPSKNSLAKLYEDTVAYGLEQYFSKAKAEEFRSTQIEHIYYGDLSNEFLRNLGETYNEDDDLQDRYESLKQLKAVKSFDRSAYNALPGKTALKESLADIFSPFLRWLGLSGWLIGKAAPDIKQYWNPNSSFGSAVRERMIKPLQDAMDSDARIMVVSHSLGTMLAYDTFWKFSYYGEHKQHRNKKIDTWITLGSPLGDGTVQKYLKGANSSKIYRRYPRNVLYWYNIAAEDDYISHDQSIRNDYVGMLDYYLVSGIQDYHVHNMAIRHGKSNPHSSIGYLIHPATIRLIGNWI